MPRLPEEHLTGPPNNVTLRPETDADESLVFAVYSANREQEMAAVPWSADEKEQFLRFQFVAQQQHYREKFSAASFSIILYGAEPVGRLYVDRREEEIRVLDFGVLPKFRGNGIGTELLEQLMKEARQTSRPLTGYVEVHQRSVGWLKRLGFVVLEDHGVSYLIAYAAKV